MQLKELLTEDGPMISDGFWTNKIKSHCIILVRENNCGPDCIASVQANITLTTSTFVVYKIITIVIMLIGKIQRFEIAPKI